MLSEDTLKSYNIGMQMPGAKSCWQRLVDYSNKMTPDQQVFVNCNAEVVEQKTKLMEAFSLYLFERFKEEFSRVPEFQQLCNSYIDTVLKVSQDYSKEVINIMDENKALKAQIAKLTGGSNG